MTENLNEENMKVVVQTIFRKAQNEKEYCNFYGDLCERIIRLELTLRGKKLSIVNYQVQRVPKSPPRPLQAEFRPVLRQGPGQEGDGRGRTPKFKDETPGQHQVRGRTEQESPARREHPASSLRHAPGYQDEHPGRVRE